MGPERRYRRELLVARDNPGIGCLILVRHPADDRTVDLGLIPRHVVGAVKPSLNAPPVPRWRIPRQVDVDALDLSAANLM